ncbi:NUDIX hydrolase [Natribaculum luteum]|uniref:NUDIX hydrolase n=1 Tax=Natribaculum luteum TaxID=1586232 RepID=A0ABD5NVH5_9EURY|nr:NUDIX hydrolase [Natribaculum luteum]
MTDDITNWEVESTDVAYSSGDFDVRRDVVTGLERELSVEYLETADAVTVLPFRRDGRVILAEEWRHSVKRTDVGLPSGQIEPVDDTPADAARRELREETGYEVGRLVSLGSFEPLNSLIDASIHYFVAEECRPTGDRNPDADESIRIRCLSLETARGMVRDGDITDMKTALALLYYSYFEELTSDN